MLLTPKICTMQLLTAALSNVNMFKMLSDTSLSSNKLDFSLQSHLYCVVKIMNEISQKT